MAQNTPNTQSAEEGMQATGELIITDFESFVLGCIFLAVALMFSYSGARTYKRRGQSSLKGAFLGVVFAGLIVALITLILATAK